MKLLRCIAFALLYPIQSISSKDNMPFVKDYLKFSNIQICAFLSCDNTSDRLKNQVDFEQENLWTIWWSISGDNNLHSLNYTNTLKRLSSPLSVVIDLECRKSMDVLKEVSGRKMFHYERSWVVFGKNRDQAHSILKNQFINMDAEIYLVLPDN